MTMKLLPQEERPVEKIIKNGGKALSNSELLAIILGAGSYKKTAMALAEELLLSEEGLLFLVDATAQELMEHRGIGKTKAARLIATAELVKRIAQYKKAELVCVTKPEDVAKLFYEEMRHSKKEEFKALLVNSKGGIISIDTISVGDLSGTIVNPREVFRPAIKKSAAAIIFVHNHPSGDVNPSQDDIETTKRLVECGRLLSINIVDHIIIGDRSFFSFKENGYIT